MENDKLLRLSDVIAFVNDERNQFDLEYEPYLEMFKQKLDSIPAVDAVEVVRCRDCDLSRKDGFFCTATFHGGMTFPNDFCSNADRIRAMSDEELANELGFVAQDAFMYGCGERERMMLYPFENYKSTLDWLQSPVGGDGDD